MNPDGLSYLDLASEALSNGPFGLVNGYWSPGYPALISIAFFLFRPSAGQEFPLIHFVNFLIFMFTLWAFSVFLRNWLESTYGDKVVSGSEQNRSYVTPFAFSTFLYFTLEFIGVEVVTPDLGVAAIVFLAAGISCRLSLSKASWKHYAALGFVLGVGYYFKASMFPLGLAFLALLFFLSPSSSVVARQKLLLSFSVFLVVAAPLVVALSVIVNRPSFGESARLNYAWYVNELRWADDVRHPKTFETREHPAPKLLKAPVILEFTSPINGTYPLWYDPSYWYSGATVHFDLLQQIAALRGTLEVYGNIALQSAAFISGAIVLYLLALRDKLHLMVPRGQWWQLAWPLVAFFMYALVHVEGRFLGAFLILWWLVIYGALMVVSDRRVTLAVSATVVCAAMLPFTAHLVMTSARIARDLCHPRPPEYQTAARGLSDLGLQRGDSLAVVGYAYECYYARFARLRVVTQIPDTKQFWRLSTTEFKDVAERLASIGVRAVVASNRPDTCALLGDWKDVNVSDSLRLSVLLLSPEVRVEAPPINQP